MNESNIAKAEISGFAFIKEEINRIFIDYSGMLNTNIKYY